MRFPSKLAILAAAPLAACASVGPDFERPEVAAPAAYVPPTEGTPIAASGARSEADWWRALGAPRLDALISDAFAASPTLEQADAALDAARASAESVYGRSLPQLDGRGGVSRERVNLAAFGLDPAETGFPAGINMSRYTLGAAVTYDFDLWGRERRAREAARAGVELSAYRAEAARLMLAGNIALKASEAAALRRQIEIEEAVIEDDRETVALVRRARAAGGAAEVDQVRADAQLAQDQASLPAARERLAAAQHALAILTGRPPGAWSAPDFDLADFAPPADIPLMVPSELVRGRPDILAAEADLHAAMARIGVAEARLYPDVSLTGDFALIALHPEDVFKYDSSAWNIGPSLTAPLFHGGSLRADRRRAEAEAKEADARYRAVVLQAFGEVADALTALSNAEEEVRLQAAAVSISRDNLRLARRAYELGAGNLTDVLDAQRQLSAVERGQAEALGRRLQAIIRLYAATATSAQRDSAPGTEAALHPASETRG